MCYINGIGHVSKEVFIAYKQQVKELKQLMAAKLFYQPARRSFDYTEWPIIVVDASGDWDAVPMEWGIIPPWIKTRAEANIFKRKYLTYNAVGSELFNKRSYANPARQYRCLVPSTGFYEHRHIIKFGRNGQPLKASDKIPYHISVREQPIFFMAGIYSPWFDPEKNEMVNTFSICTTDAGPLMKLIHNSSPRQPTILTAELAERWTENVFNDEEITAMATHQFDNSRLKAHTVGKDFLTSENPSEEVFYDLIPDFTKNRN